MRREAVEGQRRSARISALEEKARLLALERLNKSPSPSPPPPTKRRGRKRKCLQAFGFLAFPPWDGEEPKPGERMVSTFAQIANFEPLEHMPSIEALEFILDLLQRKDTQEMFAQPIDPDEVPNYYSVIKEPMDFGTMRAKVHEKLYEDFSQFEHDLLLIADNAVKFHDPNSIHYYEAVEIGGCALRIFHGIRVDPENFYLMLSRTRRRPRKASTEANRPSSSKYNSRRNRRRFKSNYSCAETNFRFLSESRDGGSPLDSSPTERRMTYTQNSLLTENEKILSQVYEEPKQLIPVKLAGEQYGESLMRFVEDLGPAVQMAARRKLLGKTPMEALSYPLQNPHSNILSKSFYRSGYDGLRLENDAITFGGETFHNYNNMVSVNDGTVRIGEEISNYEGNNVCDRDSAIRIGGEPVNNANYGSNHKGKMVFGIGIAEEAAANNYNHGFNCNGKMVWDGNEVPNNHNYSCNFNEKMGFGYGGGIRNGQEVANNYDHSFNFKEKMGFGGEVEETATSNYDLDIPHNSNVDLLIASLLQIGSENKFNPSSSYFPLTGDQNLAAQSLPPQPPPPPSTTIPPPPLPLFPPRTITASAPAPTPALAPPFLKYRNVELGHNINVVPAPAPTPAPAPAPAPAFLKYRNGESGLNINIAPAPAPAFLKYRNGESGQNINVVPAPAFLKHRNGESGSNNVAPSTSRRPPSAPFWLPAKSSPSPLLSLSCQVNNVGGGENVKPEESFWMNAKRYNLMQSMQFDLNL